ncbi:MAG: glycosyltransferase family 4 protein [Deltaproteobacteria bacterium]|nr:glycosyltransferase family 4 protein [Deltaproteobacteria bacterium]
MATILVLGVKVPFTTGGAEALVKTLVHELRQRNHDVDTIDVPISFHPKEKLLTQAAIWRNLELTEVGGKKIDLVIATKFPTYYVSHPNKSIWLVHQHRPAYDLYGTRFSDFSDDPRDEALRRMIAEGDRKAIGEAAFISGISKNVTDRLLRYNGISGVPIYPPLPLRGRYKQGRFDHYILSVGRLCNIKRVDMMIKALPIVHNFVKLKIVGTPDESGVMEYYRNEIDKHHLWDRVEFLGRVSDEELIDLYSNALGVYYAPYDEDYGYVTLEAFASGKPVITAKDSGGVLEFMQDGERGFVLEPTSDAIGHGVNKLVENVSLAQTMGENGLKYVKNLGLLESGWDQVIEQLLSPIGNNEQPQPIHAQV